MQIVPSTTAIRRNRVANVDSSRLCRRHQHLLDVFFTNGASGFSGRIPMAQRAAELMVIENELMDRGFLSNRQIYMMRYHAESRSVNQ
jgi:hypothetical protein